MLRSFFELASLVLRYGTQSIAFSLDAGCFDKVNFCKYIFNREKKEVKRIPKDQKLPKWGETLPADVSRYIHIHCI